MKRFANLLYNLVLTPSRNRKLDYLTAYLKETPDPERGFALGALTGGLAIHTIKSGALRDIILERVDPELFAISYDYVGDLAETIALMWPSKKEGTLPSLSELIHALTTETKQELMRILPEWLDHADETERWALLKVITGNMRIGLSEKLAKTAVASLREHVSIEDIEELWHGLEPPYAQLFDWIEQRSERPAVSHALLFRPMMLSHPLEETDQAQINPQDYAAEWKWDGIRAQIAGDGIETRLFSRSGDNITDAFPDLLDGADFRGVLDGELLVMKDGKVAPFNDLQQRLNRRTVSVKMLQDYPVSMRLYDILFDGEEDVRPLPFLERRERLEAFLKKNPHPRFDISSLVPFSSLGELADVQRELRNRPELQQTEGFMLKRKTSPYLQGRIKGNWWKWKRDPLNVDVVLMYAQRGHGKRSSYYSDYTFGAWANDNGEQKLLPVGKAYSGYTDEELLKIDRWIRNNTTQRFGPVREVKPELVFELAFDGIFESARHKSGVAMRFPRISRIRWDKPVAEADTVDHLKNMIGAIRVDK
ncbi:MAG: cisplatin damage response ATP-dependent DNA ligase [Pseudomonadota bacterium]